jgi:putative oxidoreductase
MKMAVITARILLGLIFVVFGLNGFLNFIPRPRIPPSYLLDFVTVMGKSHYMVPVFVLQVIGGLLLLVNRFVPLALALLGPVLVNIWIFHLLFQPSGLPPGAFTTLLWLIVFYAYRQYFAGIFTANATPS